VSKRIRILNVNDREIPRYVNEQTLARGGFQVVSVATGQEALALATTEFDVVLLDVQLPDLDGFEICQRIKTNPATAGLIILLTSATFVTAKNKVLGLDSGADGYLVQPYEPAELFATLRSLLRARAAERRAQTLADELGQAMAVRDEFLAMLGHELRNPLATIVTALHVLELRRDGDSLDHYLKILSRQSRSLERIVGDLLDVARMTRGKVSLDRVLVDLRDVADRCVQSLADEIRAAGHTIALELPPAPVIVSGDVVRLEQVAANLVTNAVKYTPKGGHIRVRVAADGPFARFEVTDDGIGMSPEVRERVFDVFVQGHQTLERSRGGLGLGLTVVRELVEMHDGTVAAFSDGDGKGSRFVVELPLLAEALAAASAPAPEPIAEIAGLHIVVIEDNDDARGTLQDALLHFQHQVDVAADGIAGLDLVLEAKPDVVLVDIGLPRLDGYEVARQIRSRMNGKSPRLIAMTGYGQPEDAERATDAGFDLHIVKPVSLKNLQRVLATVPTSTSREKAPRP
jgi:signal transduction histidine kinase